MTPRELFHHYAAQRQAVAPAGFRRDEVSGLARYTPLAPLLDGLVMFAELADTSADEAIAAQVEYFRDLGRPFEWKHYEFDTPADLRTRLETRGFVPGDAEAFMLFTVAGHRPRPSRDGIRLARITSREGLGDVISVQQQIWGDSFPWLEASLAASLEESAIFCAYAGDTPVGTGWMEFPPAADFAELHGGSVLPGYRGRGIYTMLFEARIAEAARHGRRYLSVDASPKSRPILLGKGFTYICETVPLRKDA